MNRNSFSLKNKNSVRQRSLANPRRRIGRRQRSRAKPQRTFPRTRVGFGQSQPIAIPIAKSVMEFALDIAK